MHEDEVVDGDGCRYGNCCNYCRDGENDPMYRHSPPHLTPSRVEAPRKYPRSKVDSVPAALVDSAGSIDFDVLVEAVLHLRYGAGPPATENNHDSPIAILDLERGGHDRLNGSQNLMTTMMLRGSDSVDAEHS